MSGPRSIRRLSLDLEAEQHTFAKLFAMKNGINVSVVMRAMLFRLETDPVFANEIIDLIFAVPEDEVDVDFEESIDITATAGNTIRLEDLKKNTLVYDAEGNPIRIK
jgi:hypothetical protein